MLQLLELFLKPAVLEACRQTNGFCIFTCTRGHNLHFKSPNFPIPPLEHLGGFSAITEVPDCVVNAYIFVEFSSFSVPPQTQ